MRTKQVVRKGRTTTTAAAATPATKRTRTKQAANSSLALAPPSPPAPPPSSPPRPESPEADATAPIREVTYEEVTTETADDLNLLPLTPEEDDQLSDVLEDTFGMSARSTKTNGDLRDYPWHESWEKGFEPPKEAHHADIPPDVIEEMVGANHDRFAVAPTPEGGRGTLIAHCGTRKITREELALIGTPAGTRTHQPLAHHRVVEALIETLHFRHIAVMREEYAVSTDGHRMFGVLDLDAKWNGVRFSVGLRNANDKSMRLGMTVGYRVTVCDNMMFKGDFAPVFHKHTRRLELSDVISVGVDKMQRGFEPLRRQIKEWRERIVTDDEAKLVIYRAFVGGDLPLPRHLLYEVHTHYFRPEYDEFQPRTLWALANAFTSAFKRLKPVPQFQATAKLGGFLGSFEQGIGTRAVVEHEGGELALGLALR